MILVRTPPPIGLLIANFLLLILAPTVSPLFAVASYFYYIVKNRIYGNYFLYVYILLICGYFSVNVFFSDIYEGDLYSASTKIPIIYILFVYVSIASALMFGGISNQGGFVESYIKPTRVSVKYLAYVSSFPFAITLKVLYVGLSSGADYGSQAWREVVGNSLNGLEWMLFKLWVIVPAMLYMLPSRATAWRLFFGGVSLLLSTTYGGRFLLFCGLVLMLPLTLNGASAKQIFRVIRYIFMVFLAVVVLGALRYAIESNEDISFLSVIEAFNRQNAGVVYDFLLSYGLADVDYARALVADRLRVASVPGLFSYDYDDTLGGYLAQVSGRGYEFGHRIGGPGEVFYLGGHFGVVIYAVLAVFIVTRYCDRLVKRVGNMYVEAALVLFSILFANLIDFSNIPNLIHYVAIVYFLGRIYRLLDGVYRE